MQEHKCRSWRQLKQWAKANTACWRYPDRSKPGYRIIDHFSFCPENSPYAAKVAEVLGSKVEIWCSFSLETLFDEVSIGHTYCLIAMKVHGQSQNIALKAI